MKLLHVLAFLATGTACGACYAAEPTMPAPPADWLAGTDMEPVQAALPSTIDIGPVTIAFEKTTLAELAQAAGGTPVRIEGSDGRGAYALCYTLPEVRLWVLSDAEMGGTTKAITDAVMAAAPSLPAVPECPSLGNMEGSAVFLPGFAPGSPASALTDALGTPSLEEGNRIGYLTQEPTAAGSECTLTRIFGATIDETGATSIRVRQITSC